MMRRQLSTNRLVASGIDALIGNTPLIRLRGPSERTGSNIYGKAEFLNPAGSVKDREARSGRSDPGVSAGALGPDEPAAAFEFSRAVRISSESVTDGTLAEKRKTAMFS